MEKGRASAHSFFVTATCPLHETHLHKHLQGENVKTRIKARLVGLVTNGIKLPRLKYLVAGATASTLVFTGVACSSLNHKDVYSQPDWVTCIYDKEDGKLIKQLNPGDDRVSVEDDAIVVLIPSSNRFIAAVTGSGRDPGFPEGLVSQEATRRETNTQTQGRFRFNTSIACKWYEQHGRRNADESGSLGFNVRGDANQGWARYLIENMLPEMVKVNDALLKNKSWQYLEDNLPTNANQDGIVPDGEEAGPLTLDVMEVEFGEMFTKNLNASLGDNYFCGITYDPLKPDVCPPITFDIYSVSLVDQTPVNERRKLEETEDALEIAEKQQALLDQQQQQDYDFAVQQQQNQEKQDQLDYDNAVAASEQQNKLDDLKAADEIAELKRQQGVAAEAAALEALKNQQAAKQQLAPCIEAAALNGGVITADECAKILLALQGKSPSVPGSNISIGGATG